MGGAAGRPRAQPGVRGVRRSGASAVPLGNDMHPGGEHYCNVWQGTFPNENTNEDGYYGTAPGTSFAPNAYGLHNVVGNAWEWCLDWFDAEFHRDGPRIDPTGPPHGTQRVMRGGSSCATSRIAFAFACGAPTARTARRGTSAFAVRQVSLKSPDGRADSKGVKPPLVAAIAIAFVVGGCSGQKAEPAGLPSPTTGVLTVESVPADGELGSPILDGNDQGHYVPLKSSESFETLKSGAAATNSEWAADGRVERRRWSVHHHDGGRCRPRPARQPRMEGRRTRA